MVLVEFCGCVLCQLGAIDLIRRGVGTLGH